MSSPVEEIGPATNLQDVQMTLVESLAANKTRLLEQNSLYHKFIVENLKMIQRLDDISARTSKAIEESGKKAIAKISQQLAPQDPTNVLDFLVPGQSLRSPQDAATQVLAQDATKTLVKKTVDGLENAKETQIKELPLKKRIKNFRHELPGNLKEPPPQPIIQVWKSPVAKMVSWKMPEVEFEHLDRFEIVLRKGEDLQLVRCVQGDCRQVFLGGSSEFPVAVRAVDAFNRAGPYSRFD